MKEGSTAAAFDNPAVNNWCPTLKKPGDNFRFKPEDSSRFTHTRLEALAVTFGIFTVCFHRCIWWWW